jgi:hypothetical protein
MRRPVPKRITTLRRALGAPAVAEAAREFCEALEILPTMPWPPWHRAPLRREGIHAAPSTGTSGPARRSRFVKAHLQLGCCARGARARHRRGGVRSGLEIEPRNSLLLVNLAAVRLAEGDRWGAQTIVSQLDHIGTVDAEERELAAAVRREIEAELR